MTTTYKCTVCSKCSKSIYVMLDHAQVTGHGWESCKEE